MPGRAQPVDHVERRDAAGRDPVALEAGAADPHVADDVVPLVTRQVAARGVVILAARLQVLPPEHLGRGEVGVGRRMKAGGQEPAQVLEVARLQGTDLRGHADYLAPVTERM